MKKMPSEVLVEGRISRFTIILLDNAQQGFYSELNYAAQAHRIIFYINFSRTGSGWCLPVP